MVISHRKGRSVGVSLLDSTKKIWIWPLKTWRIKFYETSRNKLSDNIRRYVINEFKIEIISLQLLFRMPFFINCEKKIIASKTTSIAEVIGVLIKGSSDLYDRSCNAVSWRWFVGFCCWKSVGVFAVILSYKPETRGMVGGPVGFSMRFLRWILQNLIPFRCYYVWTVRMFRWNLNNMKICDFIDSSFIWFSNVVLIL